MNNTKSTPHSATATKILENVILGLTQFEEKGLALDEFLDSNLLNSDLRRSVSSILFALFRHKLELNMRLKSLMTRPPKPFLQRVMLVTLTQIYFSSGIAPESAVNVAVTLIREKRNKSEAGFVNAVLRKAINEKRELEQTVKLVIPPALLKHWQGKFTSQELESLTNSFLTAAPNTFRCRYKQELSQTEMETIGAEAITPINNSIPWRYYSISNPQTILQHPDWAKGRFYFQDPATSVAMSLPDYSKVKRAIDICAAPGGKALMARELMEPDSTLIAADRSERRQQLTRENFKRCNLDVQILTASPWEYTEALGLFDLVVADVPCSNTGVFRRRPDALWQFNPKNQKSLHELQYQLLTCAASRVNTNGQLLYSTCSIEQEENELMIEKFLTENPSFIKIKEYRLHPTAEHDGAFSTLLQRKN